jgi:hypothetical protein
MTTNLGNAIAKARRIRCAVKMLSGRTYLVTTLQRHTYTVRFEQINGLRYGRCNCKAGAAGMACYHLPKAALVDRGIQQMRTQQQTH